MQRLYTRICHRPAVFSTQPPSLRQLRDKLTASGWGSAEPLDAGLLAFGLQVWVAADGRLPQGSLLVKRERHSHHPRSEAVAAVLSRSASAGTSGRAAPPYKQMTQQSPPSASGLPVAGGHRRPCWSDECACRTQWDPG